MRIYDYMENPPLMLWNTFEIMSIVIFPIRFINSSPHPFLWNFSFFQHVLGMYG